jgi:hypothetical protein
MILSELLEEALDDALKAHFNNLFNVLCAAPDHDPAIQRFHRGLRKSIEMHRHATRVIEHMLEESK